MQINAQRNALQSVRFVFCSYLVRISRRGGFGFVAHSHATFLHSRVHHKCATKGNTKHVVWALSQNVRTEAYLPITYPTHTFFCEIQTLLSSTSSSLTVQGLSTVTAQCLALLLHIHQVPDSHHGLETGYPDVLRGSLQPL
jgi:hypothetical protein